MIPIEPGDAVMVKINGQTASLRTRRRVKENGPSFIVEKVGAAYLQLGGVTPAVLLASTTTNWVGWLPKKEIIVSRTSI
jgi:hypothetical protein